VIGLIPAVAPSDDLAVILQAAGACALIGTAVAARLRRRYAEADAWLITARWTVAGAIGGIAYVLWKGLP
jgi:hypothetical protein